MKWYHSDLIASTNHNCCLLQLLYKTDDSESKKTKRKGFLLLRLPLLSLKIVDDNVDINTNVSTKASIGNSCFSSDNIIQFDYFCLPIFDADNNSKQIISNLLVITV